MFKGNEASTGPNSLQYSYSAHTESIHNVKRVTSWHLDSNFKERPVNDCNNKNDCKGNAGSWDKSKDWMETLVHWTANNCDRLG